jgi:hypothetical protein
LEANQNVGKNEIKQEKNKPIRVQNLQPNVQVLEHVIEASTVASKAAMSNLPS